MPHFKPTGPISLQGAPEYQVAETPLISLKVQDRQPNHPGSPALANPEDFAWSLNDNHNNIFLQLANGSDCILSVRLDLEVPPGCLLLDEVQQFNLHILSGGEAQKFRVFILEDLGEPSDLVDVEGEVRLLRASSHQGAEHSTLSQTSFNSHVVEVDARELSSAFLRTYFGRVIAVNELLPIAYKGNTLVIRITSANVLGENEREEVVGYHSYRGVLSPSSTLYLSSREGSHHETSSTHNSSAGSDTSRLDQALSHLCINESLQVGEPNSDQLGPKGGAPILVLTNILGRQHRHTGTDVANVTTSDEELFPVKKKLLRPCIALTKVVRDAGDTVPSVHINVDCLTFDRVLLFLEAHLLGKPPPQWSLHLVDDLAKAAEVLGLRPLTEYCQTRLGAVARGVAVRRYQDVVAANSRGGLWLILDSMVLDVKAWLPEHPGGASIIPSQSLNVDCARFFEMYHASRESFLYLRDFYIGEIHPDDRSSVPQGGEDRAAGIAAEPPSSDFLQQLREYTQGFRLKLGLNGEVLQSVAATCSSLKNL
ncbi:hypothetical protein CEUSTIGMA_g2544.t1 [Chlamydomonas eustigma]|uniref:Cytochrome b5 heme-binding domain-containing protein n=1 Tax=Chlamydomonas eustigma TaxID=1157962 RepID=A0A250WX42_9CHLO|nr:hypothetical protein CEUSTIGMA_g2544.t1 [Chlamydomonas eustigma]|eukprot:GAX75100.1 hypothetical protein CEUSTIGMA_g2544.t1 [Chlamydomonas eustigma]